MISGTLSTSFRSLFGNWSTSDSGGKTWLGVGPVKGLHQGRAGKVRPEIDRLHELSDKGNVT